MGHDLGMSESYWRPRQDEVLEDYLKAVDLLTINYDNSTLQKQVAELTEKSREENYGIKEKLAQKEKEIEAAAREAEEGKREREEIKAQMKILQANTSNLIKVFMGQEKELKIHVWNEKEGPIPTTKSLQALEEEQKER